MTDEKRAQLVRNLVMVVVFASAITLGYFIKVPVWDFGEEKISEEQADKEAREALAVENGLNVTDAPPKAPAPKVAAPSGLPGMERVGSGVPGMTRAKPDQNNLRIEPVDKPKE